MFTVVADQLRISEGWVRCGECGLVFDGRAELMNSGPLDTSTEESGPPPTSGMPTLASPEPMPYRSTVVAPPPVSFLRLPSVDAVGPGASWLLWLVAILLLAALAAQVALHERNRLAATWPAMKPWLQSLCAPVNCVVGAYQKMEDISVESSSFSQVRGEAYRLQVVLRNTGEQSIAMPALELSVTDGRDEVLVRRVFQAAEFSGASTTLAAHADWSASLNIGVSAPAAVGRVAGYRVLAFYP